MPPVLVVHSKNSATSRRRLQHAEAVLGHTTCRILQMAHNKSYTV